MFDDISFESTDDKWLWGGVLGGVGVALITTGVVLGCVCRKCLRDRKASRRTKELYKENARKTVLCVDESPTVTTIPSAPPYVA